MFLFCYFSVMFCVLFVWLLFLVHLGFISVSTPDSIFQSIRRVVCHQSFSTFCMSSPLFLVTLYQIFIQMYFSGNKKAAASHTTENRTTDQTHLYFSMFSQIESNQWSKKKKKPFILLLRYDISYYFP